GIVGRIAARLARVPVIIYTAHAFSFHQCLTPARAWMYAFFEHCASPLCDVIVVDSDAVKLRGLQFKVAPPEKIYVIPMGVDSERFSSRRYPDRSLIRGEFGIGPNDQVIGTVSRLVPDKGLECFLQAVRLIADNYPNLKCLFVGGGPLEQPLRQLARN